MVAPVSHGECGPEVGEPNEVSLSPALGWALLCLSAFLRSKEAKLSLSGLSTLPA